MNIDERLKNVLISDKHFDTKELINVLKTDLYELIFNYFDISPQDIDLNLTTDDIGSYILKFEVKSDRVKIFGSHIN